MGVLAGTESGPFGNAAPMRLGFAGAEATVAIGVSRLGHSATWIGRVGADGVGRMIIGCLRAEDVDVSHVQTDHSAPTGLMLRERRLADHVRVTYYRRELAGSRLCPEDVDERLVREARVLHISGITPAIGPTAKAAVHRAVDIARAAGTIVSLDINYRALLWSRDEASAALRPLAQQADVVFAGPDEATLLVAEAGTQDLAAALTELGPDQAIIKLGDQGALAVADGEVVTQPAAQVRCVDPIGAGDAFVAGYLTGLVDGRPADERLRMAAVCGAFAVSVPGDWEGLPRGPELDLLSGGDVHR